MAGRLALLFILVLPVVWIPAQYGLPFNAMTILAGVVWLGAIALVFWTGWPKTPR